MQLLADLHTHTSVSHHAFSTLRENCILAAQRGINVLATTNHAYGSGDSANNWHFGSMWIVPRRIEGVWHLRGSEANLMDLEGNLDLNDYDQRFLDWIVASLHTYCVKPQDAEAHTHAYLKVLENPYVDTIGHIASTKIPFEEEAVVRKCAETGKMLEINPHAMQLDPGSIAINKRLLALCKRYDARITIGSDAHICYEIGAFDTVRALLDETGFPEALVFNADPAGILRYINAKPNIKDKFEIAEV